MSEAKAPAPPLTRVVQLIGLTAIGFGVWIVVDAVDCEELGCLATIIGAMLIAWGFLAVLSGLRNFLGFACLLAAIIIPLLIVWATPQFSIPFLVVVAILARVSAGKLKGFYRRSKAEAA